MILIQTEDFDLAEVYRQLRTEDPSAGAIVTFTGLVRDFGDVSEVRGLYLEHYPGMTEAVIGELVRQARQRFDAIGSIRIIHRVGELQPEEQIVLVGVTSHHRAAAFAACEFLMDALKTSAPFWKKELTDQGGQWVEQKQSDQQRSDRWQQSRDDA